MVDRVVMENVVRIRRVSIPVQSSLRSILQRHAVHPTSFHRPAAMTSDYFFAIAINIAALGFSLYETSKTLKRI